MRDAWRALLTPDAIAAALDDRTARLELLALQLRTLDASIHNLFGAADIARDWKITSGNASLVAPRGATAAATAVHYDFARSNQPIELRADFEFPCEPRDLHKLILTLRPDDSWHRLDATLDVGGEQGGRWVTSRTTPLAQNRAMSLILQPPGFEDQTLQPRTWVPLERRDEAGRMKDEKDGKKSVAASSPSSGSSFIPHPSSFARASRPATLTLTITPSSTAAATWSKATRNYSRAFYAVPFWRYVGNSLLLVALTTLGTLFSSTFVAYAFARLRWPGRGAAMLLLLATMMLPQQVTMVPSFLIWRGIGWYNTLNPLWAPSFLGVAFFIFLMTQHMKTLPRELEESARVDGLNALQTWYYIILPQVKPAAAAVAVMTFMWSWNEFLAPLIYLRDQSRFPLSLGLFAMRLENFGDWSLIMAANVLMTLPVIVLFFLCQRYFIEGMTMSGMKA
jgi:ABC-type glycerol-3-phosphate transport system permease component